MQMSFTFRKNEMSSENEGLESMTAIFRSNVLPTILVDLDQASHDVFWRNNRFFVRDESSEAKFVRQGSCYAYHCSVQVEQLP